MKAIMLMFDSLNRHFLPSYGCPASKGIKTPNFDRLAERTVRFERSYAGSLPCMPARRELHTGCLLYTSRRFTSSRTLALAVQSKPVICLPKKWATI